MHYFPDKSVPLDISRPARELHHDVLSYCQVMYGKTTASEVAKKGNNYGGSCVNGITPTLV